MDTKFDFGWGNPYFLLEILDKMYNPLASVPDIKGMSYAPDNGMEDLKKLTLKAILKTSIGIKYPHITITNGATQAINSILRWKRSKGYEAVYTGEYGYPFYEDMIDNAGLTRLRDKFPTEDESYEDYKDIFWLIDSPSNPQGNIASFNNVGREVVWDAVYHNQIYLNNSRLLFPNHSIMVGSYSKLLGLTGSRIGFIATSDPVIHEQLADISLKDTATISVPSQKLLIDILNKVDLEDFMKLGNKNLNYNREEFQKIEYLFDNQPIQENGMFYCANADKKALQLFEKCGIKYVELGDDYIRLSLGQTLNITSEAIKLILKEDNK